MPLRAVPRTRLRLPQPLLSTLVTTASRLRHHTTLTSPAAIKLFLDYVAPAIRSAVQFASQLVRTQILPRILAAAAALINQPPPRSHQRVYLVIIVPIEPRPAPSTAIDIHPANPTN